MTESDEAPAAGDSETLVSQDLYATETKITNTPRSQLPRLNLPPKYRTLKVKDEQGNVASYKVKPSAPMKVLKDKYCQLKKLVPDSFHFFFERNPIYDNDTLRDHFMLDNDVIDVFIVRLGDLSSVLLD